MFSRWDKESVQAITAYCVCSASLVLINKFTVHLLDYPSTIIVIQLAACLLFLFFANLVGWIELDAFDKKKLAPYGLYTIAFTGGVYANMKVLQISNVETVIVFRCCSPVVVAVIESLLLGREWPSLRSWAALFTIVLGAMGYVHSDTQFVSSGYQAYTWPFIYLCFIAASMTYGKKIVSGVKMNTFWGPVLYANGLGLPPMLLFMLASSEQTRFEEAGGLSSLSSNGLLLLLAGCVVGTAISYAGWYARSKVSATTYTIIGVMNKCATVLVNCLLWDNHASTMGIASLFLCLLGGIAYEQAPMKRPMTPECRPRPSPKEPTRDLQLVKVVTNDPKPST